jgi:hypothetical protein
MSEQEKGYSVRTLLVTAVACIIGTVLMLEATGRIEHSDNKGHVPVGEFQAIHLKPGEEFRMSRKSSELHAACVDGYLAIAADVDPSFRGILVDYKNRGVRCVRPSPTDRDLVTPTPGATEVPDEQQ